MKPTKVTLYILFLFTIFYNCQNVNSGYKSEKYCDCLELKDFDTTEYPVSGISVKPYIDIYKTTETDSGCIYSAMTKIFLDTIPYNHIMFYKRGTMMVAKLTEIKSQEFTLFDYSLNVNENFEILIKYNDSLTQKYVATLCDKIKLENNDIAFVYRIHDFFYWYHDYGNSPLSMDVILFITDRNGIIGSYIEARDRDGSVSMIAPSGNILSEYTDYSGIPKKRLQ